MHFNWIHVIPKFEHMGWSFGPSFSHEVMSCADGMLSMPMTFCTSFKAGGQPDAHMKNKIASMSRAFNQLFKIC